ncbi:MAG: GNAT family protein [Pseudomonadota bacterium]
MLKADDLCAPMQFGEISLTPFNERDKDGLKAAANDAETWRWFTYRADDAYFDTLFWPNFVAHHKPPEECHFVVHFEGEIVGATCLLAVSEQHKRLEIGGTWYRGDQRGGVVNPVCKLLMIERAFECGMQRVELKTDSENKRSRAAIEKLGALYEGTLRRHMVLHDGTPRDTVYYSILVEDWPPLRERLKARIEALT